MSNGKFKSISEAAWDDRAKLSPASASQDIRDAVEAVIGQLNNGSLRVASRQAVGQWTVHQWIKKSVLLSFRLNHDEIIHAGDSRFFDKLISCPFASFADSFYKRVIERGGTQLDLIDNNDR